MEHYGPETCAVETTESPSVRDCWCSGHLSTTTEVPTLVEVVAGAMAGHGYQREDIFGLRLALEEALINAVRHGHGGDPAKKVQVRYRVRPDHALVEVEDQGPGFDPNHVPDPLAEENLERPGGRGLLLMRAYTTWLRYGGRGNRVTLCKVPSAAGACG